MAAPIVKTLKTGSDPGRTGNSFKRANPYSERTDIQHLGAPDH